MTQFSDRRPSSRVANALVLVSAVLLTVRQHFLSGVRSGVNGTPTFFINGIRHDDAWDLPTLTAAIDRALRSAET